MNIAELFVRIRGDTTDLHRKLTDAEQAMLKLERGTGNLDGKLKIAGLSTGRLGNQFAGLAGRIAHLHPIVGNLASVLGDFAVGGLVTAGVLAGLAAMAVAYDKLTASTRKTREEQDKLIKSLEAAIHLKGLGPGGETVDQVKAARDRAAAIKDQITTLEGLIVKDAQDADVIASNLTLQRKINDLYSERQNLLNDEAGGQSIVNEKVNEAIAANTKKVKEMTFGFNELRNAAEKVNAEILQSNKDWWRDYIEKTGEAVTLTEQLNRAILAARPSLLDIATGIGQPPGPVDISPDVKIANDQAKKINDAAAEHSQMLHDAIWGSAAQLANSIVSALNFGGGGRGSNVGGSIGSTIGFGIGFAATSFFGGGAVGGAIGSLLGNIGGSLIGGLFDHKKAVDNNTAAVRQNTAALLLNSPSGYKTAGNRFNATDIKDFRNASLRYNTRGGAPILVTP